MADVKDLYDRTITRIRALEAFVTEIAALGGDHEHSECRYGCCEALTPLIERAVELRKPL